MAGAGGVVVRFAASVHAVERFEQRVRPGLSPEAARRELLRLCGEHGCEVDRPAWLRGRSSIGADVWIQVADGIVVPCHWSHGRLRAITVLTRAGMSPEVRGRRNRQGKARRQRTAMRRIGHRGGGGFAPEADEWA